VAAASLTRRRCRCARDDSAAGVSAVAVVWRDDARGALARRVAGRHRHRNVTRDITRRNVTYAITRFFHVYYDPHDPIEVEGLALMRQDGRAVVAEARVAPTNLCLLRLAIRLRCAVV